MPDPKAVEVDEQAVARRLLARIDRLLDPVTTNPGTANQIRDLMDAYVMLTRAHKFPDRSNDTWRKISE